MSHFGKSTLRLAIYGGFIAYMIGDLFIFHGVLHRTLLGDHTAHPDIAARVSGHPITVGQLERALGEQLWLEGKSIDLLTPSELEIARKTALDELIEHYLLRLQVHATSKPISVSDEEINERLRRLVGRFESKGALETAMKSQGIPTEPNLRERLTARIRQEKFIAQRISPATAVTEDEARKWFDDNQASVALPERIEARHIFLPTLDHPPEEVKQKLTAALAALTEKKKDFTALAKEVSEDPATKDSGGALGWMTRDRLPIDFAAPVFSLALNTPSLVRTRLGWHLVEVTARKPAEPRTFDDAETEIISGLEAVKRRQSIENFLKSLRNSETVKIEVFQHMPR